MWLFVYEFWIVLEHSRIDQTYNNTIIIEYIYCKRLFLSIKLSFWFYFTFEIVGTNITTHNITYCYYCAKNVHYLFFLCASNLWLLLILFYLPKTDKKSNGLIKTNLKNRNSYVLFFNPCNTASSLFVIIHIRML